MNNTTIKVYLCQQKNFTYECKMFNNFLEADDYNNQKDTNSETYILPICKFTPKFMHNFILKYKIISQHKIDLTK